MEQTPALSCDIPGASIVKSHLSADDVADMAGGRLPADRQASLEAHLAVCAQCRAELVSVTAILASAPSWVSARRSRWPIASIAAAAAIVLIVLPFAAKRGAIPVVARGQRGANAGTTIGVVGPAPAVAIDRDSLRFAWHGDGWSSFRLFVTDSAGAPLFTVPTTDTTMVLPSNVQLSPSATYFWYLDALRPDGSSASTRPSSFTIRPR